MNLISLAAEKLATIFAGRRSYVSMRHEPENISSSATVQTVQSAIRAAEGGDTRQLFALYRDLTVGGSHIQCELGKRLMAVLSEPEAVLPADKENKDDILAAEAVKQMIGDCENWEEGIAHLLSSTLWPVSVVEKLFEPADAPMPGKPRLRYTLRKLHIVNPTLLCFKQPYQQNRLSRPADTLSSNGGEGRGEEEPWEKDLRFYNTEADGRIDWSFDKTYAADKTRHIIHRGHLLVGVRDNWGGPMRSIVFWWLLAALARDWFARNMERYGSPFLLGKTDSTNQDAINFLRDAFSLSTKIGGLVVDHDTQVELIEAMTTGMADAHERFLSVCNREISKVIVGQTLSAEAQPTGLGSSTGKLQGEVREDIRQFDQKRLGSTITRQLFDQFLYINGLSGRVKIVWGGLSAEDAAEAGSLLVSLSNANLEPTDEAIPTISERVGFQLQRKPAAPAATGFPLSTLSSNPSQLPRVTHPSDAIAAKRAQALGAVYRGRYGPIPQIILESNSAEEALAKIQRYVADLKPGEAERLTEEALQISAAAGAAAGKQ